MVQCRTVATLTHEEAIASLLYDDHIKEPKMLSLDAFSRAEMRLAAGLHPDPLGELQRSPRHQTLNCNRGRVLFLRGGEWEEREEREREGVRGGDCLLFI